VASATSQSAPPPGKLPVGDGHPPNRVGKAFFISALAQESDHLVYTAVAEKLIRDRFITMPEGGLAAMTVVRRQ